MAHATAGGAWPVTTTGRELNLFSYGQRLGRCGQGAPCGAAAPCPIDHTCAGYVGPCPEWPKTRLILASSSAIHDIVRVRHTDDNRRCVALYGPRVRASPGSAQRRRTSSGRPTSPTSRSSAGAGSQALTANSVTPALPSCAANWLRSMVATVTQTVLRSAASDRRFRRNIATQQRATPGRDVAACHLGWQRK